MATGLDTRIPFQALEGQYDPSQTMMQQFKLKTLLDQQKLQQEELANKRDDRQRETSLRGIVGQYLGADKPQRQELLPQIAGLDPDTATKLMDWSTKADETQRKQLIEQQDTIATAAASLAELPQEQRAAAFQQMAPMLIQRGVSPEILQQADLSDTGLRGYMAQALGIKGLVEKAHQDRTFSETQRHNRASEGVAAGNLAVRRQQEGRIAAGGGSAAIELGGRRYVQQGGQWFEVGD